MARLYLTGGVRLDGPTGSIVDADLPGTHGRIALTVLVVERRPIPRDALAEIVWDGRPPPRWDATLAPTISKIRTLITRTGLDGRSIVQSVGRTYAMALPAEAWVDLEDAIRRLDRSEGALRHGDPRGAAADATAASAVLRRPFLAGIDGEWVGAQRRRQRDLAHRCFSLLARAWMMLGDIELAVTNARSAIEVDPYRETAHRLAIEAELARGDRGAALRALERCRTAMAELGVVPDPATEGLLVARGS